MSDTKSSTQKERDEFLAGVKAAVANVWIAIHPKGRRQINLQTYRRMSITLNWEEKALRIVGDLAKSDADKILMLNFEDSRRYAPNGKGGLRYPEWKNKIDSTLPAFKYWLLNEFELPDGMRHQGYGVQYYNPELSQQLAAPTQEELDNELDVMIRNCCFVQQVTSVNQGLQWRDVNRVELTAGEIIDRLTRQQSCTESGTGIVRNTESSAHGKHLNSLV